MEDTNRNNTVDYFELYSKELLHLNDLYRQGRDYDAKADSVEQDFRPMEYMVGGVVGVFAGAGLMALFSEPNYIPYGMGFGFVVGSITPKLIKMTRLSLIRLDHINNIQEQAKSKDRLKVYKKQINKMSKELLTDMEYFSS